MSTEQEAAGSSSLNLTWTGKLAVVTGILAAAGFLFLLFYTAVKYSSIDEPGRRLAVAMVGLLASVGVIVIARLVPGLAGSAVLLGLGILILLLPAGFLDAGPVALAYGAQKAIVAVGLLLLVLMFGVVHARRLNPESAVIKWVLCGVAGTAMILQLVVGLMLLTGSTDAAREVTRRLGTREVLPLITFIWTTVALWAMLILGLVNALCEKKVDQVASAGLVLARVYMWSIVGLVVLEFILALTGGGAVYGGKGEMIAGFIAGVVTVLLPLFAAAHLCAGALSATLLRMGELLSAPEPIPATAGPAAAVPQAEAARQPASEPAPQAVQSVNIAGALESLAKLRDQGLISESEFQAKRQRLLDRI